MTTVNLYFVIVCICCIFTYHATGRCTLFQSKGHGCKNVPAAGYKTPSSLLSLHGKVFAAQLHFSSFANIHKDLSSIAVRLRLSSEL